MTILTNSQESCVVHAYSLSKPDRYCIIFYTIETKKPTSLIFHETHVLVKWKFLRIYRETFNELTIQCQHGAAVGVMVGVMTPLRTTPGALVV